MTSLAGRPLRPEPGLAHHREHLLVSCMAGCDGSRVCLCVGSDRQAGTLVVVVMNVLGTDLEVCSVDPLTGFARNGCCESVSGDLGVHVVCAVMTDDFLAFSKSRGNDLSTPRPEFDFGGLSADDRWCLCAARWKEALDAGVAPPVVLASTHVASLEYVSLKELQSHSLAG